MIVLVGFMGSGKSTVGRMLAAKLDLGFADSDEVIERDQQMTIVEMFEEYGEEFFRKVEAATIVRLLSGPDQVLALGGGSLGSEQVRKALRPHHVVFLDVPFKRAKFRIREDPARPMLKRDDLEELYNQRIPVYRQVADLVVPASGRPGGVVKNVMGALARHPNVTK